MAPLKDVTPGRARPEPFPDLDNDTMPADAFELWDEGAVDDLAHISQRFAREADGVDFGVDTDPVPPGFSVPNIWR
jgi:hypothetical protein